MAGPARSGSRCSARIRRTIGPRSGGSRFQSRLRPSATAMPPRRNRWLGMKSTPRATRSGRISASVSWTWVVAVLCAPMWMRQVVIGARGIAAFPISASFAVGVAETPAGCNRRRRPAAARWPVTLSPRFTVVPRGESAYGRSGIRQIVAWVRCRSSRVQMSVTQHIPGRAAMPGSLAFDPAGVAWFLLAVVAALPLVLDRLHRPRRRLGPAGIQPRAGDPAASPSTSSCARCATCRR